MQTIKVTKAFRLALAIDDTRHFAVGEHVVEPHIADHWYTVAHCAEPDAPAEPEAVEPAPLTPTQEAGQATADELQAQAPGDNVKAMANAARRAADAARKAARK